MHRAIFAILLLLSLSSYANLNELVGRHYNDIESDLSGIRSTRGACLLDCDYGLNTVFYDDGNKFGLVLSKSMKTAKKWHVVDVLADIKLKTSVQIQVNNCTSKFSKRKSYLEKNPNVMISENNIIAFVKIPETFKNYIDYWVPAIKAFKVDETTQCLISIAIPDVYCYVGIG